MNPLTTDLDCEEYFTETQRQWLVGLVRCHLLGWNPAEQDRYQRKVRTISQFAQRSMWYAECRAYQVMARLRLPSIEAIVPTDIPATALKPATSSAFVPQEQ